MAYSHEKVFQSVNLLLCTHPSITLTEISDRLRIDRHTIEKVIHSITGQHFRRYRNEQLLEKAHGLLLTEGTKSIKEIAFQAGFASSKSFHRAVLRTFHKTPSQIRADIRPSGATSSEAFYECQLIESFPLSVDVWGYRCQLKGRQTFSFDAGQSIGIIANIEGRRILRLYSIASSPEVPFTQHFELCIKTSADGLMSRWFAGLKAGDSFKFCGPFGMFTLREPVEPILVFVATGTGIAPIRAMLQFLWRACDHGCRGIREIWLFFGVHQDAIPYYEEFELMCRAHTHFHFVPTVTSPVDSRWQGRVGHVQEHLEELLAGKRHLRVYLSGQYQMYDQVRRILAKMGQGTDTVVYSLEG